jgi:PAS domain S-box-containing protein
MKKDNSTSDASKLRQKAEEKLGRQKSKTTQVLSEEATQRLIHNLEIHQIELEMQQEELILAKERAEILSERYTELFDFSPIGKVILSKEGSVINLNFWLAKKLEKNRVNLTGSRFAFFISVKTRPVFTSFIKSLVSKNQVKSCEAVLAIEGQADVYVQIHGRYLESKEQYALNLVDITQNKQAEKKLEIAYNELNTSAQTQNAILNALSSSIALINSHGEIIAVNESWKKFGKENNLDSPNDGIGANYIDISNKSTGDEAETGKKIAKGIKQVINGALPSYRLEYPCDSVNEKRWFRMDATPVIREQTHGAVIMHTDITERKQAEENLIKAKEQVEKNRKLLNETEKIGKVGGWEINIDTLKQIWTEETYLIHEVDFNFDPNIENEINFYTSTSKPIIDNAVKRAIEFGESFNLELELITAKNNIRNVHAIAHADIENRRVYGFFQDITKRKQDEALLLNEKERINTILNLLGDPVFVKANDHKITFANTAFCTLFGLDNNSVIGKTLAENVPVDEREHFLKVDRTVLDTGIPNTCEERLTINDLTLIIITEKIRFTDQSGNRFLLGSIHDITALRIAKLQAEESALDLQLINKSYKRTNEILETSQKIAKLGGWELDLLTNQLFWTSEAYRIYDTSPEEFNPTMESGLGYLLPQSKQRVKTALELAIDKGENFDLTIETHTTKGRKIDIRAIAIATIIDGKPTKLTGIFQDITESKQVQEALRISKERYSELFRNLKAGIVVHAADTSIIMNNSSASEILGLSEDQMRGKEAIDSAWKFIDAKNNTLPVKDYPVTKILASKKPIKNQILGVYHPKRKSIVWVTVNGYPVFDSLGKLTEAVVSFIDFTERKEAQTELEKHRNHLETLVEKRTSELSTKNIELDKAIKVFVGRELKIRALEKEIKEFKKNSM